MNATEYPTNPITNGMRRVSKTEFYAAIGPQDVMSYPEGRYDEALGYQTPFRIQSSRVLVGYADGGTHLCPKRYWLV